MRFIDRRAGIVLVCAAALAACGGSSSGKSATKSSAEQASATTAPSSAGAGSGGDQGRALGKIRVANFLTVNGAPGPAMDLYDRPHPTSSDTPIIKDLQYGAVSGYVSRHTPTPYDTTSNLYVFPTGSTQPSGPLTGSGLDNAGFEDGDQLTIAIGPNADQSSGPELAQIAEAGSRAQGGDDLSAPAGQGVVLARSALGGLTNPGGEYLSIDGTCPNATNNDEGGAAFPDLGETKTFTFPVAPGSHTFGAIPTAPGTGLSTCAGHAPTGTATASVDAGQRVEVFVYGTPSALKVTSAPVGS